MVSRTKQVIDRAASLLDIRLDPIPVVFDLRGRGAGMYKACGDERCIRYNPWVFAVSFEHHLEQTVPHEVAHYAVDRQYGIDRVKPHGAEWKAVMAALGCPAIVSGDYSLQGVLTRTVRRFQYHCGCQPHSLTSYRHLRILRGKAIYRCRVCNRLLRPI